MEVSKTIPILFFCALPAAGKSEARNYLLSLSKEEAEKFHLGDTSTQLDDYPYVDACEKMDSIAYEIFGKSIVKDTKIIDYYSNYDWGTFTYLLNEDYHDLKRLSNKIPEQYLKDPVEWLLTRLDTAAVKTGHLPSRYYNLKLEFGEEKFNQFKKEVYSICEIVLKEKYANIPNSLEGKTIVFEFSRGGKRGATMPLETPNGYEYSLGLFDDEILNNCAVLYLWVTADQSFSKNQQRSKDEEEGTAHTTTTQLSLTQLVPNNVLINHYGCDDIEYLIEKSETKNYLPIYKDGKLFKVKCGRFDNRQDLTSDFRKPKDKWTQEQIQKMEKAMVEAFNKLFPENEN